MEQNNHFEYVVILAILMIVAIVALVVSTNMKSNHSFDDSTGYYIAMDPTTLRPVDSNNSNKVITGRLIFIDPSVVREKDQNH